jgi:hypothetical protein
MTLTHMLARHPDGEAFRTTSRRLIHSGQRPWSVHSLADVHLVTSSTEKARLREDKVELRDTLV